jgi:hypothetical protein
MRALGDPGVVPAYFHVYGHPGETDGLANIFEFLRLLFSCLWPPTASVCSYEAAGADANTKSSLSSASDRSRFSSRTVDMRERVTEP